MAIISQSAVFVIFHPVRKGPVFRAFFDFGEFFQNIYLAVFRSFLVEGKDCYAFFSIVRALSRFDIFPSDPFNSGGLSTDFLCLGEVNSCADKTP